MSQQPDTKPGNYYVTVTNEATGEYRPLLGPFPNDHAGALAMVDDVMAKACDLDPRGIWYDYGTARLPEDFTEPGLLNDYFPQEQESNR